MVDKIFINVAPGETRIALMDNNHLSGLTICRKGKETIAGNIYMGRVSTVLSGLQAAFVDCGLERAGFLSLADLRPVGVHKRDRGGRDRISDYVSEGDLILVQVLRDPEDNKGAKLTTRITLTGRDLVFILGQTGVTLSRRIKNLSERERLTEIITKVVPEEVNGAFVVRYAAQEAEAGDLEIEVESMVKLSLDLEKKQAKATKPECIYYELEPPLAILRDHGGVDLEMVQVDDSELYKRLHDFADEYMHDLVDLISVYDGKEPLFEKYGVEELILEALSPKVDLPSGGNILISETSALTAIDVNTGGKTSGGREQTSFITNSEASGAIAKQVQLRNLSGLLVIDFVPMRKKENLEKIIEKMNSLLSNDAMRPHIAGFTKLGLLEMTRRKRGSSLSEILGRQTGEFCKSIETIALEIFREVIKVTKLRPTPTLNILAAPSVVEILNGEMNDTLKEVQKNLGVKLKLTAEPNNKEEIFQISSSKKKK